jgi:heme exporter protein A
MLELRRLVCARGNAASRQPRNLVLDRGGLLYVKGDNGSGKSSLLRTLCGLLAPAAGAILWRGEPIADLRQAYWRDLFYLGHAAALKEDLSVLENVQAAALLAGLALPKSTALGALHEVGLRDRAHAPARILSQGQRRRVALARLALDDAPPLWILDEPFVALDGAAGTWLQGRLTAHLAGGGLVVLTSHQPVGLDMEARCREICL